MEDLEKPFMKPNRLKAILLFIFSKSKLIDMAYNHDLAAELHRSKERKTAYVAGTWKPDEEVWRERIGKRLDMLRSSLGYAALIVLPWALLAMVFGYMLRINIGALPNWLSGVLQGLGAALILWASLWRYPTDAKTIGEVSLPERLHDWIFGLLYTIGTFMFFIVYTWQA